MSKEDCWAIEEIIELTFQMIMILRATMFVLMLITGLLRTVPVSR